MNATNPPMEYVAIGVRDGVEVSVPFCLPCPPLPMDRYGFMEFHEDRRRAALAALDGATPLRIINQKPYVVDYFDRLERP